MLKIPGPANYGHHRGSTVPGDFSETKASACPGWVAIPFLTLSLKTGLAKARGGPKGWRMGVGPVLTGPPRANFWFHQREHIPTTRWPPMSGRQASCAVFHLGPEAKGRKPCKPAQKQEHPPPVWEKIRRRRRQTAGGPPSGLGRGSPANCLLHGGGPGHFSQAEGNFSLQFRGNSENPQITNNGKESRGVRGSQNLTFRVSPKGRDMTHGGWHPRNMPTDGDGGPS